LRKKLIDESDLQLVFDSFDLVSRVVPHAHSRADPTGQENKGFLSRDDLVRAFDEFGESPGAGDIASILGDMNVAEEGDGRIDFATFRNYFKGFESQQQQEPAPQLAQS
jgi:hypothetical protein